MQGGESLTAVVLTCSEAGESETVACAAVFVFIGSVPHTKWLSSAIAVDPAGFVKTGPQLAESGSGRCSVHPIC